MAINDAKIYQDGEWHSLGTSITTSTIVSRASSSGPIYTAPIGTGITTTTTYPITWTGTGTGTVLYDEVVYDDFSIKTPTKKEESDPVAAELKRDAKIEDLEERLRLMERQVTLAQRDADLARMEAGLLGQVFTDMSKKMEDDGNPEAAEATRAIRKMVNDFVTDYDETHPLPDGVDSTD